VGGFGSGRFGRRSRKPFDRGMVRVSLADLRRAGLFNPVAGMPISTVVGIELSGRESTQQARLLLGVADRRHLQSLGEDSIVIRLLITAQPFGGRRVWFACPRANCRRRCSVVYRPLELGSRAFACQRCTQFRYVTQCLNEAYRYERRAERVMKKLVRLPDGTLRRPRGMSVRTYERHLSRIDALMRASANAPPYFPLLG
jgi:hypothetical protein